MVAPSDERTALQGAVSNFTILAITKKKLIKNYTYVYNIKLKVKRVRLRQANWFSACF